MLKRINWKMLLYGFIWLISLSGLVVLMSFIDVKKQTIKCRDVKVILPGAHNFIEREEVDRILLDNGGLLVGRNLNDIDIHKLENKLKANPFIEYAKIFADMNGLIYVQIRQREPVLRVINMANVNFYIDRNGLKIPMSDNFTARVLVVNGFIDEDFTGKIDTLNSKMAKDLYKTALFITKNALWNDQVEQLFVNLKSEIEIVPRVGDHKIILGDADSLETKFRNLLVFYKKAMPKVGWDTYKSINLKYTNQIICERNTDSTVTENTAINKQVPDSLKSSQDSIKNIISKLAKEQE